jgi:hypothetical protein
MAGKPQWGALCLLFLMSTQVKALEVDFQASVDRTRVGQTEPIRLTLKITTDENLAHMPAPELSLADFVVEGPSISIQQQVNVVNASFQASFIRELTYVLYPRRKGRITIGPARLKLAGKVYETEAIEVEIAAKSRRNLPRAGAGAKSGRGTGIEDKLYVQVSSDREKVYVGQQVTLDYELIYCLQLYDVGFKEIPSFAGFWVEELFVAQQLKAHQQVINGIRFNVAALRRVALFPTSAGKHRVEPLAISCEVPKKSGGRSLLDQFSFRRSAQSVVAQSEEVEIEVLPLPLEGQPMDFTGAVGRFSLRAQARPAEVPAGDPVTLTVKIAGQGNMDQVKPPDLEGLEGFKVYDPKVEEQEQVNNNLYGGSRIYEYILIPERGGLLEIPPIRFAYFDPLAASYQIAQSNPITIVSSGTPTAQPTQGFGLSRKDIQEVGQDIRHIKPDLQELEQQTLLYKSRLFWVAQATMPLALWGLLLYQRHQRRLEGDVVYARRRRAKGEASKRLERARQLLKEENRAEFHAEIQHAVTAFLADQLNLSAAALSSSDTCAELLRERGVDQDIIGKVGDLLDQCDFARFAPTASSRGDMVRVQKQAEQIIASLERLT